MPPFVIMCIMLLRDALTRAECGTRTSRRSSSQSSASCDARYFNVKYSNLNNPKVDYHARNDPSSRLSHQPQAYSASAHEPRKTLPLTQHNLHQNNRQWVDPIFCQRRQNEQYASQVAAAQSLGIDMTNGVFTKRGQPSSALTPMESFASGPDPRFLAVTPLQAADHPHRRGTRL
ncbi:hypothetical protein MMC08_008022 [Hypocenomyce scalaris]|nr:hypothetical protein [Hypocenomyce scalaris]